MSNAQPVTEVRIGTSPLLYLKHDKWYYRASICPTTAFSPRPT